MPRFTFVVLLLLFFCSTQVHGQTRICPNNVPFEIANLTGSPDSIWISSSQSRDNHCCGASNPDRCIEFIITLDPGAQGIRFDIESGAPPSGSLFYQINCGPPVAVGQEICLNGIGPHNITFCKPGNNPNSYRITSIAKPSVSPPTVVSDGCTGSIFASGYIESTITWRSVPNNPVHDAYLSATSGQDSVTATFVAGAPAFVNYEVCGTPTGGCVGTIICDTVQVSFVSTLDADIQPKNATICFGSVGTTLTANGVGGLAPYTYLWNTGATTQSIVAATAGTYSVIIDDATSCPIAFDTVVVTDFPSTIVANAGPDRIDCNSSSPFSVALNGSVQAASGGVWTSTGSGTFSPNNTTLNASYLPSAAEITAGQVLLTLTTTGNGTCPADTDQVYIRISNAPVVDAGNPISVCANNASVSLNGSVSGLTTTGVWSTSGTGSFTNINTLSTTYNPSAADIAAGNVTITLTSTNNGVCTAVTDNVSISITAAPLVIANADVSVCANNPNVLLSGSVTGATTTGIWTTNGIGTFSPNNTTLNATYIPSAADITAGLIQLRLTSTNNNNCNAVFDVVNVTITPAPIVNAGVNISRCRNNLGTITLNGSITGGASTGIWTTTNGTGSFSPNNTALNANYIPSVNDLNNGSITMVLSSTGNTGGTCLVVRDTMVISITPAPIVNAGADQTACANNITFNLIGNISAGASTGTWASSGTGSFNPNNTSLTTSYVPSNADILAGNPIRIILTSTGNTLGTCNAVSDTLFLNITPSPIVNAGANFTVCASNPSINLSGTVSAGASTGTWSTISGTGTFAPNANTLNPVYTPSAADITAGSVSFILSSTGNTGGTCLIVRDTVLVSISPRPVVNAGANITRCRNNIGTISLVGTVSGGASTGSWTTNGSGVFTAANNLTTNYTPSNADIASVSPIQIILSSTGNTGGLCDVVRDTLLLQFTAAPSISAGANQSICANNIGTGVVLNGSISGGASAGIWTSSGTGTFSPNSTNPNATYLPSAGDISGGTVSLKYKTSNHGITSCTADSSIMIITIHPAPVVSAGTNQSICANAANSILLNGTVTGGASTGTWTTNGTGLFTNANSLNTTYTLSAADKLLNSLNFNLTSTGNSNGTCIAVSNSITLSITPAPIVNAGANQTVCKNNALVSLAGTVNAGATTGNWSTPNGTGVFANSTNLTTTYTPSIADRNNGSVQIILTSTGNTGGTCFAVSDTLLVNFTPEPVVNAGANQTVCANNAIINLAGIISGGANTGTWTTNGTNVIASANSLTTTYTPSAADILAGSVRFILTSTGNTGGTCIAVSDTMFVTITPAPIVNAGADITRCNNNLGIINLSGTISAGATTGIWSTTGTGVFTPSNTSLNAIYTPSNADITSGSVTLTLTSTGNTNGTCTAVADNLILTITPRPIVNAGNNITVCANNSSIIALNGTVSGGATTGIWSSSGTGSFANNTNLITTYTLSVADKAAGSVIIKLISTGNTAGTCRADSSTFTITILPAPIVNAGIDRSVCSSNSNIVLNGTVIGGANTGIWTSSGSGTFLPNNTTLNAIYQPSAADILAGTVNLTLTSSGNSGNLCTAVADIMVLTITQSANVNAGPDIPVCRIQASITLNGNVSGSTTTGVWTTNGTGTFTPNANTKNAVYTLSATDTTLTGLTFILTSTNNGLCGGDDDTLQVIFSNSDDPSFTYTSGTYCFDDPANKTPVIPILASGSSGTFTSTPAGLSLNSNTGSVNVSLSAIGNYTIKFVTNGPCPDSSTVLLTITNAPNANFSYPGTFCKGNVNAFPVFVAGASAGFFTSNAIPSSNLKFINQNTGEIDVYNSVPGTYTVTNTIPASGTCPAVSANNTITIDNWVRVSSTPNSKTVCANNANVQVSATINAGPVSTGTWKTNGDGTFIDSSLLTTTYIPGNNDKTLGTVTVRFVSANPAGVCDADSVNVQINISPAPIVDAGISDTICAANGLIPLNGSVINGATKGRWTSTGTGTFSPNDSALNANYIYSAQDRTNGSVKLYLTSIGNTNNTCLAVVDSVLYHLILDPIIDAGNNTTICFNIDTISLNGSIVGSVNTGIWSSSGTGFFIPNNTTNNAKYILSNADKTAGSVRLSLNSNAATSICAFVSDTITITILQETIVNAGANTTVCANNDSIVLNGTVTGSTTTGLWQTGGDGSFIAATTTLNNTYIPGLNDRINGSVLLSLISTNNGTCIADTDLVQITITPAPVVNAGANQTVCENNINININGTVSGGANTGRWTSTGTGTFLPTDSTLNATYIPSSADLTLPNIRLILSSTGNTINTCWVVRDTLQINFIDAPTVNAGLNQSVCRNNIIPINLNGVLSAGITKVKWNSIGGDGTFSPNDSTLNASYTLGVNDIITGSVNIVLLSTDHALNFCNAVSDTMQISITPSPVVNAGIDRTVCGGTIVAISGTVTGGASTGTWRTSNGTGVFANSSNLNTTYTPSAADFIVGNISIILESTGNTAGTCNMVADTFVLNFTPVPIVDAGPNQSVCADIPFVQLNGSVTVTTTNGVWTSTGTGTFLPSNTDSNARYILSAADTSLSSIKIYLNTVGGIGSCANTIDSMIINISPAPVINAGANSSVCSNNPIINLNGLISGASNTGAWISSGTGTFNPNANTLISTYTPSNTDISNGVVTFILVPSNIGTCISDSDFVQVTITPAPIVDAGTNQNICANVNTVNLSGNVSQGAITGRWTSNGTGTFSPNDSSLNAIYNLTAADKLTGSIKLFLQSTGNSNGTCIGVTDSITVTILPSVQITFVDTIRVCANNSAVQLQPTVTGTTASILWSTNGSGTFVPNNTTLNAFYIPSLTDTLNQRVVLTLTIGNIGGCLNTIDSTLLLISPSPQVSAGQNISVCFNNDTIRLNGTIFSGANTGTWNTNGTGQFIPNANTFNALYVPSVADKTSGQIRFILNSTGNTNNTCIAVSDTLFATITPAPIVDAGTDESYCANNANVQLNGIISAGASTGIWTSTGTGIFTPNNTVLNPIYLPSTADLSNGNVRLRLTSTDHGLTFCNAVADSVLITFSPSPIITLLDTVFACITDNSVNIVSQITQGASTGLWQSLGSGSFSPNNTDLNVNYIPSAQDKLNGNVRLTIRTTGNTLGTCIAEEDTITIIFTPLIFMGDDDTITVCKNNNSVNLNGFINGGSSSGIWSSNGTGFFLPNNSTLNAQYQFSAADTANNNLILTLQSTNNGGCDTAESNVYINFIERPFVSAGPDINICSNSGLANLTGVISGGASKGIWTSTGTGSFLPNDTTLNAVYIPSNADFSNGSLILRLSTRDHASQLCLAEFDEMNVNLFVSATVTAGPDRYVCYGDTATLLIANAAGANPFRYFWSTGDTTANILVGPGTYYIRIQDINDCIPTYDTVEVIGVDTIITALAGIDTSVCIRTDSVQLNGVVLGFNEGNWIGNGTFSPDSSVLNAFYYPTPAERAQGFFDLILSPSQETGCTFINDTVRYIFVEVPEPAITGPLVVCVSNATATYTTPIVAGVNYNWSVVGGTIVGVNNTNSVNVNWTASAGTITLIAQNVNGCDTILQQNISNVGMQLPSINGTLSVCNASAFNQQYSVTNNIGNTYQWIASNGTVVLGQNTNTATVQWIGSGQLIVIETGSLGCEVRDTINFIYNPLQASIVSPTNAQGCAPLEVSFTSTTSNPEPLTYEWIINGDTLFGRNQLYRFDTSGNYEVKYVLSNGICTDTIFSNITVFEDPFAGFEFLNAPLDTLSFPNDTLVILNTSEINADYFWNFNDGTTDTVTNPIHKFTSAGTYDIVLRVTDKTTGCISYVNKRFVLEVISNLNSPNIFTPNGDGINDNFRIYERNLRNFKILIFNRWGQIVYTSYDPNFEWDGTHDGQDCTPGAYVYHIVAIGENNVSFKRTDIVNLVR